MSSIRSLEALRFGRAASLVLSLAAFASGCHFDGVEVPLGQSDMKQLVLPNDLQMAQEDMPAPTCGLVTCASMGATCGPIGDGCGGVIQCGPCNFPETCGGGGMPFQCGGMAACPPLTCQKLGLGCGPAGDGCGNTIDCGGCPMGQTCGGGGVNGQCGTPNATNIDMANGGCIPRTCGNKNCGQIGDGCGNLITCGPNGGNCPNPGESCGGGGTPGVCGKPACTKLTCAQFGYNCGIMGDGCGGTIDCSMGVACPMGTTCGGGGMPNVCGKPACAPKTCATQGFNCGLAGDGCGNTLNCCPGGTPANGQCCTGSNSCGGGGKPNVCGAPTCTPKTCLQQGFNCGAAGDGCGNLIAGGCGMCTLPDVCGANKPNVCGNNLPDGGAGGNCPGGGSTTITGTVLAATDSTLGFGNPDPIPNAVVYVPSMALGSLTTGATCEQCTNNIGAIVQTTSNTDGTFTLVNPPTGPGVTLVIQLGKWRRVLTLNVAACTNNKLTAAQTRLPRKQAEFNSFDNIPRFAINTGDVDALECVLRKMGIADTEFSDPNLNASGVPQATTRVHLYRSIPTSGGNGAPGARYDSNTPSNSTLVGTAPTAPSGATPGTYLDAYDAVLFPCTGGEDDKTKTQVDHVISYANAGGRVFLTHYSYVWAFNDSPWGCYNTANGTNCTTANSSVATWDPDTQYNGTFDGFIDQSFPKGVQLKNWLSLLGIGGTANYGAGLSGYQIPVNVVRWDADKVLYGQQWLFSADPPNQGPQTFPLHFTFNTPVFTDPTKQCGRVVYSDFHVENISGGHRDTFPTECGQNAPLTAQEKLLEFMLFDLTSCVSPDIPTCTPATCQPGQCGMLGDGCGGVLNCPPCGPGQVCGGGGVPNQCSGGCTPTTCAALGYTCGLWGDGCGNTLDCCPGGTPANGQCCTNGQTCGGGGVTGQCGGNCSPIDCAKLGATCGIQGNGCGGTMDCCPAGTDPGNTGTACCTNNGQTCGGGGIPNQCGGGCVPLTCQQLGLNCGPAGDGCGGLIPGGCGMCPMGQQCGGGGVPGVCGAPPDGGVMCQPLDCKSQGLACGKAGDGCGNLIDCGPCPTGQTCGGGGTPGRCGAPSCTPTTCQAQGKNCGIIGDGCGGQLDCGSCMSPETCGGGGQANVCGRIL